ncbi:hypothetical protein FPD46_03395 [Campylobacter peloridis]|uniref:Dual OB-containing domain-containing protein n=1 Tax=Campylobacter peloridis TaxID=488546 RepID=A0A5C7DWP8_9BACT|nr:hypothetical protein [Campylobacter peloridis]TXE83246.1 hypothetical protein FPD46_03395 [Campylobacter peloridis]
MFEKEIIIFANSVKNNKHCVAGKDIVTKEWIRAVSSVNGGALDDNIVIYENKGKFWKVKPLDRILIKFEKKSSLANQPENYLISNSPWETKFKIERNIVSDYLDKPDNLWLYDYNYIDRVNYNNIINNQYKINQSLYLIHVDFIKLYRKGRMNQSPQRRGRFIYNKIEYDLALTDPNFTNLIEENLKDKYLCISLGEEFQGYCYKIIACVI